METYCIHCGREITQLIDRFGSFWHHSDNWVFLSCRDGRNYATPPARTESFETLRARAYAALNPEEIQDGRG